MIEATAIGGWGLLALDGEVDLANAANVAAVVEELVQQAVTEVTADLTQLTFMDALGN